MIITREIWIERCLRQIYGGMPSDDAGITKNLVNTWLNTAIGVAAKANYKDNIALDGIGYVNGSFYSKFTGLAITNDGGFTWKMTLPEVPLGIGSGQGISTLELVDESGNVTRPFIPISENQRTYYQNMRPIPNKVLYYYQGSLMYAISTLLLNDYTANVVMVSGGDSSDMQSTLNVPADYDPIMIEFVKQQLLLERNIPVDTNNDGLDAITTT